jgi:hypothetical protein
LWWVSWFQLGIAWWLKRGCRYFMQIAYGRLWAPYALAWSRLQVTLKTTYYRQTSFRMPFPRP